MLTNNRTTERGYKQPIRTVYQPMFAVYSHDRRTVVNICNAEDYLELPRSVHVEECGSIELL